MHRILLSTTLMSFCLSFGIGCGSDETHSHHGSQGTSTGETYVPGLEKTSDEGHFIVQLQESRPAPAYVGFHSWTLSIRSSSDVPVTSAAVEAEPIMLAHGHGTQPQFTIAVEDESGAGEYTLSDMDLFMPGVWTVLITIETLDGLMDTVEFAFDLEG